MTWSQEGHAPAAVVGSLPASVRLSRLLGVLVTGYWGLCRAVEDTATTDADGVPAFAGDPLPSVDDTSWADLHDSDPDSYADTVRYAVHLEARRRIAALVDIALGR